MFIKPLIGGLGHPGGAVYLHSNGAQRVIGRAMWRFRGLCTLMAESSVDDWIATLRSQ
jgi:hypothetical protein